MKQFKFRVCRTTDKKITTSKSGVKFLVPDPNKDCVFPFSYNGRIYNKCTNKGACFTCFYCGTQYNVTDNTGWGMCNFECPREIGG